MIPELGHFALVLALALALIQATVPVFGARRNDPLLMGVAGTTAVGQFCFVALSFAALVACYVQSDFSVLTVFENSHSAMPLVYKLTSTWGNHEGSMLLWVLILALFGAMVAVFGGNLPARLRANVLGVQSWIAVAFDLFILLTSNPFLRIADAPLEGRDLNPLLQDLGLAIHPPMLYLGYVGFSITFSFAIAALIDGRVDAAWARWVRPWALLAWTFLTLGIAMGSYWAYYTLGWGGWWFWDPVENASLMPWLAGTALLHSALVMEKRNALKVWTILLAILAFSLSLIGTFLVRSGVLTSVHAFASDPMRGIFILAILTLFIGGALALFAWRAPMLKQGGLFAPVSREGALVLNNLFLVTACATVFVGTLYPLALEALTDIRAAVHSPDGGSPVRSADGMEARRPARRRATSARRGRYRPDRHRRHIRGGRRRTDPGAVCHRARALPAGGSGDRPDRAHRPAQGAGAHRAGARGLPRSAWGTAFAHAGLAVTLLGIIGETQWGAERIAEVKPGQVLSIHRYDFHFDGMTNRQGPNYHELAARFTVRHAGDFIGVMEPSKRTFPSRGTDTSEAALMTRGFAQLYLSLGDPAPDGSIAVRLYYKPLVLLIWLGAVVMAMGGALSLSDRRLRIGAPMPARAKAALQPAE
jgi:cytochrome c-type biogenesis protein CcmF